MKSDPKKDIKIVATNHSAGRDFFIEKTFEAGMQLMGNEVKSLRRGTANLKGSFAKIEKGEVVLHNMHINPYEFSRDDHGAVRPRKLLLHKAQIRQLTEGVERKGNLIVATKVYFTRGLAKVEIALAKSKNLYDKRHAIKKEEVKREMARALREKNR